jgi:hypothetical protein
MLKGEITDFMKVSVVDNLHRDKDMIFVGGNSVQISPFCLSFQVPDPVARNPK